MPAFGYLFPRPFTLSFFQLSWQQLSSFQLFLGSQHLHHLKCSDKTHILAPQKAFTESWEWLSQPARNLPSLYPGMRSALFAWSETLWFVILLPLFSSLKYYLVHISSLYLHCKLFLWGRAHCTHFVYLHAIYFSKPGLHLDSTGHLQSLLIQHYPKPYFYSLNKLLGVVNNFRAAVCGIF